MTAGLGIAGAVAVDADGTPAPSPTSVPTTSPHPVITLGALQARCTAAVQKRLGTLGADASFVKQSAALTSADQATLEGQISADQTGLTALEATIKADTTLLQAHTDCELIVTGYRVYLLEDPKMHEVIAADGIEKVDATFNTLAPRTADPHQQFVGVRNHEGRSADGSQRFDQQGDRFADLDFRGRRRQ